MLPTISFCSTSGRSGFRIDRSEGMGEQVGEWITSIVVEGNPADSVIPSNTVYMDAPLVTKNNCQDFM